MSEPTEPGKSIDVPEPPDDVLGYPANRVIAVMDDPDEVAAAVEELSESGFPREELFVLCGRGGAERLDPSGRHHGLVGRLYRFAQHLGEEHEQWERYAEHMEAGGLMIVVPAGDENKRVAAGILGNHGGHEMVHYGTSQWVPLGPG